MQLDFVKMPFHLEEMERLESCRMGFWWALIQRGHGHLAHKMVGQGFLLIEFLRALPCKLVDVSEIEWNQWRTMLAPFFDALEGVKDVFTRERVGERTVAAVDRLASLLSNLGYNPRRPKFRFPESLAELEECRQETNSCDSALSTDANEPSAPTSSPAPCTGTPCQSISSEEFGKPGEASAGEELAAKNSANVNEKSSNNLKGKMNTHPHSRNGSRGKKGR